MKGNYDPVAHFYDRLGGLVFGSAQLDAQLYLLAAIPPAANVLIAGGGSGWILEAIARLHPQGLAITYIDISAKMIALAQKRNAGNNQVTFIAAPVQATALPGNYDVVFTSFFFDNFTPANALEIFSCLHSQLSAGGAWLYCDFRNTRVLWQKFLLKSMYLFFRLTCGVEASRMPGMATFFADSGYYLASQHLFMKGFIEANVYKRL